MNTGLRGMFPSEYHEPRQYVERPAPTAQAPSTEPIAAAVAEAKAAVPAPGKEVTPLVEIYPRTAADVASHSAGGNLRVPLYTFDQLEKMSGHGPRVGLKLAAAQLRDAAAEAGIDMPPLNLHAQHEQVIDWVLEVQVKLAKASGIDVSIESFGVPNAAGQTGLNHAQRSAV